MLITGKKIIERELLNNTHEKNLKGGCYYLQVHSIIPAGEEIKSYDANKPKSFHTLEPGGIAWIISEEVFNISDPSVTALVTLRSQFTKKGLLALDVGLVDANFHGPIGSVVINFSKSAIRLNAGERFFRVMFLQHDQPDKEELPESVEYTHTTYIERILNDQANLFPSTFLQAGEIEERIKKRVEEDLLKSLEPKLLDKIGSRLFQKHWFKCTLVMIFAVLAMTGIYHEFNIPDYFHTESDIQKIILKINGKE